MNNSTPQATASDLITQKEILTRIETSDLLGVNLSTLWAWTKKKKVRSYGLGNKVFYKYSEILNDALKPLN